MRRRALNKRKYILICVIAVALMGGAIGFYINQLTDTVSENLMSTIDEISNHDVETIEGSLENSYVRLGSVANRMHVYNIKTLEEAKRQIYLEAASSNLFSAIYMMDGEGNLLSSSYLELSAQEHAYDEIMADGREHFAILYDDKNGKLETSKPSIIYGIKLNNMKIGDRTFVAMLGRSDISIIRDQLLIESFNGQGTSSVVNSQGYYILNGAAYSIDLAGHDNFYNVLEDGYIDGGITIEDVRNNISEGKDFVINCTSASGENLIMSFEPIEGTAWSFIMTVPMRVFEAQYATFISMTTTMLIVVSALFIVMMLIIYRSTRSTLQANANAKARSEFLSNMSHEIRTPLNGIVGLNQLMSRDIDDKQALQGYIQKMEKAAEYLLSLINDILDVSKLHAGKVELDCAPFDLKEAIDNVCEMQRTTIEGRGIDFDIQTDNIAYPYVIGDEIRLSQVLMNFLSNAAKFTPKGGTVTLSVNQKLTSSGDRAITTITVADTGCGMTESFKEHIFDEFTQERNLNSDSQKGTGLGMAISNLLIQAMRGSIEVESELGKGSKFITTVPLRLASASDVKKANQGGGRPTLRDTLGDGTEGASADAHTEEATEDSTGATEDSEKGAGVRQDGSHIRLLVAEDNELNSDIMVGILEGEGYDVTLATDGRRAVEAFEKSDIGEYTAILMDAQMPVMDGYDAARAIRELDRPDASDVYIFACTASTFAEDKQRAMDSGMNDFLPKPLNLRVMLQKLREVQG